ncbi:MAG: GAF domain-containing protein [Chloroflexi bacterium]|nr:GAF domain-containing protein [Chloroflexota bacterium]
MQQTTQMPPLENNESELQQTSLGLKLTLITVGLMLLGFIVYSIISIRIGQGNLVVKLEKDLQNQTAETVALIEAKLIESRSIAINLASTVESGNFNETELAELLQKTLLRNPQIYGVTVGYEPEQFKEDVFYWAPYYNRLANGELQFTQLGDFDYFNQEWYFLAKRNLDVTLSPPYRDRNRGDVWITTWSVPVYDENKNFRGVASTDLELTKIQDVFINLEIARTGYSFLLDSNGNILGMGAAGGDYEPIIDSMYAIATSSPTVNWVDLIDTMTAGQTGFMEATDRSGNPMYIAYQPVGLNTGWSLALAYPREEIIQQTRELQTNLTLYSLLLAFLFGLIIFYFSRTITNPLRKLTEIAEEISRGNLNVNAPVESLDEVGALAQTLNHMTNQLRDTLGNLERRIAERTTDLEISRHQTEERAAQLLAIGEISKIINSEEKLNILLPLITRLVSERFNFYHTGIFLIDDAGLFAVLQAANSTGGQAMLAREHKLKVGESGIVGYAAKTGTTRIALDVGQDATFFNNPDLPNTRSEIALPLKARDKVIGVLDVQSEKPGAFTPEDANILSILADQVAIAIENTKLLEQTRLALEEVRTAYQKNLGESWKAFMQEEGMIGYYQSLRGGKILQQPISNEEINQSMNRGETLIFHADGKTSEPALVVPIKLREQTIGVMHVKATSKDRPWTDSEINLTEAVSERLSLALENARLIQESQRQAIKEQTITEITGKIGSSTDLENVLITAVEELGRTIPGSEVIIRLRGEKNSHGNE